LSDEDLAATPNNCDRWLHGCLSKKSRNSHGIDSPILETSVGNTGTVLEANLRESGRRTP
jgi:hypothetical protein